MFCFPEMSYSLNIMWLILLLACSQPTTAKQNSEDNQAHCTLNFDREAIYMYIVLGENSSFPNKPVELTPVE